MHRSIILAFKQKVHKYFTYIFVLLIALCTHHKNFTQISTALQAITLEQPNLKIPINIFLSKLNKTKQSELDNLSQNNIDTITKHIKDLNTSVYIPIGKESFLEAILENLFIALTNKDYGKEKTFGFTEHLKRGIEKLSLNYLDLFSNDTERRIEVWKNLTDGFTKQNSSEYKVINSIALKLRNLNQSNPQITENLAQQANKYIVTLACNEEHGKISSLESFLDKKSNLIETFFYDISQLKTKNNKAFLQIIHETWNNILTEQESKILNNLLELNQQSSSLKDEEETSKQQKESSNNEEENEDSNKKNSEEDKSQEKEAEQKKEEEDNSSKKKAIGRLQSPPAKSSTKEKNISNSKKDSKGGHFYSGKGESKSSSDKANDIMKELNVDKDAFKAQLQNLNYDSFNDYLNQNFPDYESDPYIYEKISKHLFGGDIKGVHPKLSPKKYKLLAPHQTGNILVSRRGGTTKSLK